MIRRGRFERHRRLPRLHGGKLALLIACLIQTALSVFSFAMLGKVTGALITQSAADVWRGGSGERFAQVSAFLPVNGKIDLDTIRSFRVTLEDEFVQNSIFAPEPDAQDPSADTSARLYADAYSGSTQLSVSGKSPGSVTVTAIGVGGDYFLFHPLQLLSGGYVSDEDYMADRVVLDAQTAFNLFGSSDVAGMEVTINGKTFPIAGVVKSEDDFATAAALDAGAEASSDPTGVQSASKAMIYMSYAALNAMAELPIDCYEIVLPDPVSGFAKKLMTEKFPVGEGVIVQNTGRFSLSGLISVIGKFGKRVMTTNGVIYPYWENAARMAESYAALLLILGTLFGLMPAVCLTIVLVKLTVREIKRGYYKAAHAIEDRRGVDVALDAVDDHFQRDEVLTALGDDDVRVFLAGLHVELVHGLNGGQILVDDGVDAPPALLDVPPDPAAQAHVGVGVDEDAKIMMPSTTMTRRGSMCRTSSARLWMV